MRRTIRTVASVGLVLFLAGCEDGSGPDRPGTAVVSLVTPNNNDGAVAVTLRGVAFSDVAAASSAYRVYWLLASADEVRVIVVGNIIAGPLFTVQLSDIGRIDDVEAAVTDAATRTDAARDNLTGYGVTLGAGN